MLRNYRLKNQIPNNALMQYLTMKTLPFWGDYIGIHREFPELQRLEDDFWGCCHITACTWLPYLQGAECCRLRALMIGTKGVQPSSVCYGASVGLLLCLPHAGSHKLVTFSADGTPPTYDLQLGLFTLWIARLPLLNEAFLIRNASLLPHLQ